MNSHIVLAGGGHAHLQLIVAIRTLVTAGCRVTLIGQSRGHYYSGMGPGMLAGIYRPADLCFPVGGMVNRGGGDFIEDKVVRIDPGGKRLHLHSGRTVAYDLLSCNLGSGIAQRGWQAQNGVFPVKPIERMRAAREHILAAVALAAPDILVAGGGAAGVETAGAIRRLVSDSGATARITLVAGQRLLGRFPDRAARIARAALSGGGIAVIEGAHVTGWSRATAELDNGRSIPADIVVCATGIRPSPVFIASGLPVGTDGGLRVNRFLQCPEHPEIFGGGDCIHFDEQPLDKVGVYAVRQNPVLLHNLKAAAAGKPLRAFQPQKHYLLLLNLGNGRAIGCRRRLVLEGRLMFRLKDYIDRSFMHRYRKASAA